MGKSISWGNRKGCSFLPFNLFFSHLLRPFDISFSFPGYHCPFPIPFLFSLFISHPFVFICYVPFSAQSPGLSSLLNFSLYCCLSFPFPFSFPHYFSSPNFLQLACSFSFCRSFPFSSFLFCTSFFLPLFLPLFFLFFLSFPDFHFKFSFLAGFYMSRQYLQFSFLQWGTPTYIRPSLRQAINES